MPRRGGEVYKVYKFLTKMNQNVTIPCQELLTRKKKDFLTQGILAKPRHAPTCPAKQCLGKKMPWPST